ncbi:hypothetical protein HXK64_00200 [Candidatus Gracilibacteria bacterium]|nr:hypothetical protein [Candidatus Gracilibacteria bacterium]
MWEQILTGLVGAMIGGFFSVYAGKNTIKSTLEQEKMKISLDYEKLIIQERLKYYPELFRITQDIGKKNKPLELTQKAKEEFLDWRGKGAGYIILSKKSLEYFNKLKESLKANPGNGEKGYTDVQLEKIYKQRNELRGSLKDDLGISIDNYKD